MNSADRHGARPTRPLLVTLALVLTSSVAIAQEGGSGAVNLQADAATLNNATGVSVYTGNVELTRGDTVITGERMEVHTTEARRLQRVVVTGSPATYRGRRQPDAPLVKARAPRMAYFAAGDERIRLTGGATLEQGDNRFAGESIVYRLSDDTVTASGNDDERINITLFPDENGSGQP